MQSSSQSDQEVNPSMSTTVTLTGLREPQKRIAAIKNLQAAAGCGLKDAKNVVDALEPMPSSDMVPEPQGVTVFDPSDLTAFFWVPLVETVADYVPTPTMQALIAYVHNISPEKLEMLGLHEAGAIYRAVSR